MSYRKKLIEVALPLDAINREAAHEKSVPRKGHPATLHLWWARRPLAACRAVLFASLVDDPDEPEAPPEYLAALKKLPGPGNPREKLFRFIEELVKWENSDNEKIIGTARKLILASTEGHPPPVLDPFCGGGSIPLEAQRLGLEAHASDLNPVAVLITKALIDDLGYVRQDREEMEVLFTLLADRCERGSVLITSNSPFSQWEQIFKDPMTTAAAIDRLVHHSVILELNLPSYRMEQAKQGRQPTMATEKTARPASKG
jgi:hypothetical protein